MATVSQSTHKRPFSTSLRRKKGTKINFNGLHIKHEAIFIIFMEGFLFYSLVELSNLKAEPQWQTLSAGYGGFVGNNSTHKPN